VIAPTDPAAPIGCREDRVDLAAGEEMHLALVVKLARDREHALDLPGIGRFRGDLQSLDYTRGQRAVSPWRNLGATCKSLEGQIYWPRQLCRTSTKINCAFQAKPRSDRCAFQHMGNSPIRSGFLHGGNSAADLQKLIR
jgi:hypothetical protein